MTKTFRTLALAVVLAAGTTATLAAPAMAADWGHGPGYAHGPVYAHGWHGRDGRVWYDRWGYPHFYPVVAPGYVYGYVPPPAPVYAGPGLNVVIPIR